VVEATPASRWIDLSVESEFGCAVERTGAVYCWGRDPAADMGLRELPEQATPDSSYSSSRKWGPASRVEIISDATKVATATGLACAIVEDGRVRCWGSFRWGTQHVFDVPGVAKAVDLALGDSESCATLESGELRCWSTNDFGVPKRRLDDALAVSVGDAMACGLSKAGDVVCWGPAISDWHRYDQQFNQQRGLGPTPPGPALGVDETEYPDSMEVGRFRGAMGVALTGWNTLCVLRADGKPVCSTRDVFSRLRGEDLAMHEIEGAQGIAALHTTRSHACGRTVDEQAMCWGRNVYGQLGDGGSLTRERASVVANLSGVVDVSVAEDFSCASTRDDRIACWGFDRGEALAREPIHVHAVEGLRASSIAAAGHMTCALDETQQIRCWGAENLETVGIAGAAKPNDVGLPTGKGLVAVTSSWETCFVLGDASLRCGNWANRGGPNTSFVATFTDTDVVMAVSGQPPMCTIRRVGSKRVFGCGPAFAQIEPEPRIKQPTALSAANMRGCVVHAGGKLSCFAELHYWGDGPRPAREFQPIAGIDDAVAVSSGLYHDCALRKNGRVSCWVARAENEWSSDGRVHTAAHYQMSNLADMGLDHVTQLVSGAQFHCASSTSGQVSCWDDNPYAEQTSWNPVPALGPDIVELAAGSEHICARSKTGEVQCWGDDVWGQLGRVPSRVYLTPTSLPVL
jgi:alpha-tubulin suppressor-like RCC1 family protein